VLSSNISVISAFGGGLLAFFSPCILPLIPAYLAFLSGVAINESGTNEKKIVLKTFIFVIGFTIVFVLMGATATFFGTFLQHYLSQIIKVFAIIVIVLGLHMAQVLRIPALNMEKKFHMTKSSDSLFLPFLFGMAFAFGWTPCIGPILSAILIMASFQESMYQGMMLLFIFSLGLSIPFLITAFAVEKSYGLIKKIQPALKYIEIIGGVILVIFGIYMFNS